MGQTPLEPLPGATVSSPARKGGGGLGFKCSPCKGRLDGSLPDGGRVECHAVAFQQRDIFFLKRPLAMMFLLVPDISHDGRDL